VGKELSVLPVLPSYERVSPAIRELKEAEPQGFTSTTEKEAE